MLCKHAGVEQAAPLHEGCWKELHVRRSLGAEDEADELRVAVHDDGAAAAEAPHDRHASGQHARRVQHDVRLPVRHRRHKPAAAAARACHAP
jgi:hypothetical protein